MLISQLTEFPIKVRPFGGLVGGQVGGFENEVIWRISWWSWS